MDNDGPRIRPMESGVVAGQKLLGAERKAAYLGVACALMLGFLALYGQWAALKGLWLCAIWHGIAVLMYRRDPQYFAILIDKEWAYPWPAQLDAAPGVCAPAMPLEASVPGRAEVGSYDD